MLRLRVDVVQEVVCLQMPRVRWSVCGPLVHLAPPPDRRAFYFPSCLHLVWASMCGSVSVDGYMSASFRYRPWALLHSVAVEPSLKEKFTWLTSLMVSSLLALPWYQTCVGNQSYSHFYKDFYDNFYTYDDSYGYSTADFYDYDPSLYWLLRPILLAFM